MGEGLGCLVADEGILMANQSFYKRNGAVAAEISEEFQRAIEYL